ncbi:hypothetical protein PVAP13_6KG049170 [Panicum virgatum]|uniref:Uncharacterized protein n=1 Tax=Panicum virgatum TaxID=38727 RepID=A0A8T0R7Y4_PANVG|nr:hypothetical protein PVAP13_6KG049170 [Panicum virgatum]
MGLIVLLRNLDGCTWSENGFLPYSAVMTRAEKQCLCKVFGTSFWHARDGSDKNGHARPVYHYLYTFGSTDGNRSYLSFVLMMPTILYSILRWFSRTRFFF